jgi:hypothetical protein
MIDKVCMIATALMALALIPIGVGLVKRAPWSRQTGVWWAVIALIGMVSASVRDAMRYMTSNHIGEWLMVSLIPQLIAAVFPAVLLGLLGRKSAEGDFPVA